MQDSHHEQKVQVGIFRPVFRASPFSAEARRVKAGPALPSILFLDEGNLCRSAPTLTRKMRDAENGRSQGCFACSLKVLHGLRLTQLCAVSALLHHGTGDRCPSFLLTTSLGALLAYSCQNLLHDLNAVHACLQFRWPARMSWIRECLS